MSGRVEAAATEWLAAPHGQRTHVVATLAERLGVSRQSAYRQLAAATRGLRPRKRRADAGELALTEDEARAIAMTTNETRRRTGTGELCLEDVVSVLRANGRIRAERVDEATGEVVPLSLSSIRRAMQSYGLDADNLSAATPATRLASPCPNHCWQIDASVSRQFYLDEKVGGNQMDRIAFYRGKPGNFEKIARQRLLRYVITDHYSGACSLVYVLGGESAEAMLNTLITTMVQRPDAVPYGVPIYLMSDPGSGMTAQACRNLLSAMGIELIINQRGNARAKGQVERQQGLIETKFEALMKLGPTLRSLEEIQARADGFTSHYNAHSIHTRTGVSRLAAWMRITAEQLVHAPDAATLRALATKNPIPRRVHDWRIKHDGHQWDVSGLRQIIGNRKSVQVCSNALDPKTLRILMDGEDGQIAHYLAPRIELDGAGFEVGAAIIGQTFKPAAEGPADAARKELERIAMDAETDAEAALARKAGRRALGDIDPWATVKAAPPPTQLPRAGTQHPAQAPTVIAPDDSLPGSAPAELGLELPTVGHVAMARYLRDALTERGVTWSGEHYARMAALWPNGVQEADLPACVPTLMRGGLRAVGGAA